VSAHQGNTREEALTTNTMLTDTKQPHLLVTWLAVAQRHVTRTSHQPHSGATMFSWSVAGYEARRRAQLAAERAAPRMATPFMNFLGPSGLEGYKPGAPRAEQPVTVPLHFIDAMEVREKVFVEEQGVPSENEFDSDDPRSCHWIAYASVRKIVQQEEKDEDGNVIVPRKSETRCTPIGTIRLVPFPHDPHPIKGAKYWGGLTEEEIAGKKVDKPQKTDCWYHVDRKTSFHDGQEPFVKLGRLAVIPEFRGGRIASLLVKTAIKWMCDNPNRFDPSVKAKGLERLCAIDGQPPRWMGLVHVHAQEQVVEVWKKWGFEVDEKMGTWEEEGIPHVGMFKRVDFEEKPPPEIKYDPHAFPICPRSETIF
jgi:predicted GNAT family N-acyltransferase